MNLSVEEISKVLQLLNSTLVTLKRELSPVVAPLTPEVAAVIYTAGMPCNSVLSP